MKQPSRPSTGGARACLVAFVSALLVLEGADACSCLPADLCTSITDTSDLLLRGKIISRAEGQDIFSDVIYEVETITVFKAEPDVEYSSILTFTSAGNSAACGVTLMLETEYLLDLTRSQNSDGASGELKAYLCSVTEPWSLVSQEDLDILENICGSDPVYSYVGCFGDDGRDRVLSGTNIKANPEMTIAACAEHCEGSAYFGTEYAGECYCSRSSDNLNSLNVATNCDMPCTGNATEMCGGHDAISVYHQSSSLVPTTNPVTVAAEDMVNEAAYHRGVGFGVASVSCSIAMLAMGGIINPNIYTSNIFGGASI